MIDPTLITSTDPPPGGEHLNIMISPCGTKIWLCIDGSCVFRYRHLSEITIDDQRDMLLAAETSSLAVEQGQRDIPTERPEGRIVGEEEIVESRGRRSTLGIPYKSGSKEYARAYYRRNKEKMIKRSLKWQQENKERVTDYQKGYREQTKKDLSDLADTGTPKPRFEDIFGDDANTNTDKQEGDKDET